MMPKKKKIDQSGLQADAMGRSETKTRGPLPGDGAVVHENTGEADFDGLPGDELPPRKNINDAKPFPPEKAED